ncbi:MAG: 30S ribosomal protein S21 [Bacilli bacterium]|nr:30S ribosomal protein S21 [Bacilli bacterium]
MANVKVEVKGGNLNEALKRFTRKVANSGVPSELKKHREYSKPGVKRREEKKEMIQNFYKRNKRNKRDR